MDITALSLAVIIGYFLGAIPFGLLIARASGQGDIRKIGSGNIGATNVLRTGRKDLAIITLLLDAAKAGVAVVIFFNFGGYIYGLIAGAFALLGHCFPVWLKFKGGKGVATFFGYLIAACWPLALGAAAIWLACALITRMSSLSALLTAAAIPVIAVIINKADLAVVVALMAVVIFIRHRDNISRILAGTESKIGRKS